MGFMRGFAFLLVVLVGFAGHAKSDLRFYLMPHKIYKLMKPAKRPPIIKQDKQFVMVKLSPNQIESLSELIHEKLGTCGGFFDVTKAVNESKGLAGTIDFNAYKEAGKEMGLHEKNPFVGRVIKNGSWIRSNLNLVVKERFATALSQLTQFPDRAAWTENGKQASQWLHDNMLRYAQESGRLDVTARYIKTGNEYQQDSVVVKIPGTSPLVGGVLVGGHMDTFSNNRPGADDDGTGTITVMEIFKAVIDSKVKYKSDMYFAFYSAEEMGLVGSSYVVDDFKNNRISLQAVMHFDMTGYLSTRETNQLYFLQDYTTPELNEFGKKIAIEVLQIPAEKIGNSRCGYACSDHANWNRNGYATVYPFESAFNNYNRSIHTANDNMNLINFDHAIRFVRFGFAFIAEVAEPILSN